MIDLLTYKRILNGCDTVGRARKHIADDIIYHTWNRDIQQQTAYFYDYYHDLGNDKLKLVDLHPENDTNKVPIDIKFIRHASQTYSKDPITYHIQLQPHYDIDVDYYKEFFERSYNSIYPVGLYVDIRSEDDTYNRWLVVNTANYDQNQFPTFEVLRCDKVLQWIYHNKKYQMAGVLRSQNSYFYAPYMSNHILKPLFCWKTLKALYRNRKMKYAYMEWFEKLKHWAISREVLNRETLIDYVVK